MVRTAGDNLLHIVATRTRVTGAGFLRQSLLSLDDVNTSTLDPLPMQSATNRLIDKLANFVDQRVQLKLYTDDVDEIFTISKFYIFSKVSAQSYPIV